MSEQPEVNPAIVLVHGAFADTSSWNGVIERLQQQGYTVVAPANPQQSVLGVDAIALMDALGIHEALIAGFDWGARTANVVAALWPGRCKAMMVGQWLPDR